MNNKEDIYEAPYEYGDFMQEVEAFLKSSDRPKYIEDDGRITMHDPTIRLSKEQIAGLFRDVSDLYGDTPRDRFYSLIDQYSFAYADENERDLYLEIISEHLSEKALKYFESTPQHEFACIDGMRDFVFYAYDPDQFDQDVTANILLDTGNANRDFSVDDPLRSGEELSDESSLVFLAKTQGHEEEIRELISEAQNGAEVGSNSKFVASVIEEADNTTSSMDTVTFCVRTTLFKLFDLWEHIHNSKGGEILVTKDARVGLFDPCSGGGSILGIELEKDVEIPNRYVYSIAPDGYFDDGCHYDVGTTYGVMDSFWRGSVCAKVA